MALPVWLAPGGVNRKAIVVFTRQLATLLKAGIPLLRSLQTLRDQLEPGRFKHIVTALADDVEGGVSFSEGLAQYPACFPEFYVNMIKAGELGGMLDEILRRLAEFLEKQQKLRDRVQSALMYPIFIMVAAVVILGILMAFVVPTFIKMFAELGSALPLPTRILVAVSHGCQRGWPLVLLAIVGLAVGSAAFVRWPPGRLFVDRVKLKLPLFGPLIERIAVARFARTLGTLLTSGVPILGALETSRATVGNELMAQALDAVHERIKAGETVARPMEDSGVFPPLVVRMVALGEETGQLDKMLVQIADNYEEEVDVQVAGLTQLLEPVLIVGMGLVVGFIVISMFLPLFSLARLIS